jgi:LPXTG-motif cell wall-anchored protein
VIVLAAMSLGIDLQNHGKPKTGNNNFVISLIGTAITIALLWWGGFFSYP